MKIYCRKIIINKPEYLKASGPLLLAANHPNSFLDGMIATSLFQKNIYALTRGDVFKNKTISKLLHWLHLLPVYRTSEGVENLSHNYTTFDACQEVFASNGIILIFSEGRCVNEWHLRPLRKGTARLAISAWQNNIDLFVLPVGFNYSPFKVFGKNVHINFGEPIRKQLILEEAVQGKQLLAFNQQLQQQLQELVYEINPTDKIAIKKTFLAPQATWKKIILALPAVIGWLLHAPLYYSAKLFTDRMFHNDHYDAVMAGILLISYPFYLMIVFIAALQFLTMSLSIILIILMPFFAWSCVQLKNQIH